jgi:hypothetical protein
MAWSIEECDMEMCCVLRVLEDSGLLDRQIGIEVDDLDVDFKVGC